MEYRYLGRSGLKLSVLSLGSWLTYGKQVGKDIAKACLKTAYEAEINFFDTAELYAEGLAETLIGEIIKEAGWPRDELVICTKLFWGGNHVNGQGLSRKHLTVGLHASLQRLQMDYVDLLLCHRPDPVTPMLEIVWTMHNFITQGKVLYWGTSEWSAEQIREAYHIAQREHLIPPSVEQPEYNMFQREKLEREYLPLFRDYGLGTTIWSPLASGLLTGKHNQGLQNDTRFTLPDLKWLRERLTGDRAHSQIAKINLLQELARKKLNCSMAQLALAWCLTNPHVSTVIMGASKTSQISENLAALTLYKQLTPDLLTEIDYILDNKPVAAINFRKI